MKRLLLALLILGFYGCASAPKTQMDKVSANHVGEERVLSRIDNLDARPAWLKESDPFRIEGGKVLSLGQTLIPASDSLAASYRIAESNAKALISHAIEQRLDYVFQNAEEGAGFANQTRYIGAEASKLTTNSLRLSHRYFEKIETVEAGGQAVLQYRVFVLSEMDESQFKTAIMDSIRRSQAKSGLSAEFAKTVEAHWDRFATDDSVAPDQSRKPAPNANATTVKAKNPDGQ